MTSENPHAKERRDDFTLKGMGKRLAEAANRMLLELPENADLDIQKQAVLTGFENHGRSLVPGHADAITELAGKLRRTSFSSKDEMVQQIAGEFAAFLSTAVPLGELERRLRESQAEQNSWTNINEALSYGIEGDSVALHVPSIFTKTPAEVVDLFKQGLQLLAAQMKTNETLSGIQRVIGWSWLAFEYPHIAKRMGFTLGDRDEKKKEAFVFINRDDFIERYGA